MLPTEFGGRLLRDERPGGVGAGGQTLLEECGQPPTMFVSLSKVISLSLLACRCECLYG
jgi:hypothetical protein